jgi:hypothetical protein
MKLPMPGSGWLNRNVPLLFPVGCVTLPLHSDASTHMLRKTFAAWILTAAALAAQVVEGRVVNIATGNGFPNVSVGLFALGRTAYTATTDATGGFRIEAVKDGSYTAFYNVPNFRPARVAASRPFQVTAGAGPVYLDIEMAPVSKISGRVGSTNSRLRISRGTGKGTCIGSGIGCHRAATFRGTLWVRCGR